MVTLKEVTTQNDRKRFVKFPFALYKDSPYWVPPLIREELEQFDAARNPALERADAWLFLAYREETLVGRIAIIINWKEVEEMGIKKIRFGWLDFIDDAAVSKALFQKVAEIGHRHGLTYMEGPMGFSNLDKVGVLVEGYESMGTMVTWYNYPYYVAHYEENGLVKEKGYVENRFPVTNADPAVFVKINEVVKKRYGLREVNYTDIKDVLGRADAMFDLLDQTYAKLASYVPITQRQRDYFKKKYISFIDPEYIKFIVDSDDTLIAFAVVMPSFSRALQKARGKLFPFGFFHLMQAKRKNTDALFYLIGIRPDFQNKGVTAIIFNEYYKTFMDKGIVNCIRTPELEDNVAVRQMWKHFDPEVYKRRATFRKSLVEDL